MTGWLIPAFILVPCLAGGLLVYFRFVAPLRKKEAGYDFVFVEDDGTVRELYFDEVRYLEEPFGPGEKARPSIKKRYDERNSEGKLSGFILRRRVPKEIEIVKNGTKTNPN